MCRGKNISSDVPVLPPRPVRPPGQRKTSQPTFRLARLLLTIRELVSTESRRLLLHLEYKIPASNLVAVCVSHSHNRLVLIAGLQTLGFYR